MLVVVLCSVCILHENDALLSFDSARVVTIMIVYSCVRENCDASKRKKRSNN